MFPRLRLQYSCWIFKQQENKKTALVNLTGPGELTVEDRFSYWALREIWNFSALFPHMIAQLSLSCRFQFWKLLATSKCKTMSWNNEDVHSSCVCKPKSHFSLCSSMLFMLPPMSLCYTCWISTNDLPNQSVSMSQQLVDEVVGAAPITACNVLTYQFLSH